MSTLPVEQQIREIISRQAGVDESTIDPGEWVVAYGIDSLGLLVLRETIEQSVQLHIPDERWMNFRSIGELVSHLQAEHERREGGARSALDAHGAHPADDGTSQSGKRLTPNGVLYDEIEIGMPFTGLMNLAESPLLKYLGDLRWVHIGSLSGIPSKSIVDAEGNRLYPTFFYVETAFPEDRPMASYGENDRIMVASTLQRFGGSMLDGITYLLPAYAQDSDNAPFGGISDALAAGVPAVRMSNIFVMQFSGAEWLKKSRPANAGFERIPEMAKAPDSYTIVKQAEEDKYLGLPSPEYVRMVDEPVCVEYDLVPDRDLNAAGLVYFANYPLILDICERKVLSNAKLKLTPDLIDRRTLVRRRSAYLGNAHRHDTVVVEMQAWVHNPFLADDPSPEMAPIRLFMNYRMMRKSDGRSMMISTAEKIIFGIPFEEAPLVEALTRTTTS